MNGVSTFSTTRCVDWQRYCRHSLRISAPGSNPASQRIWNPLHEPSTSPPRDRNSGSASTTGERPATAPARR